jgi:hypothetical protein
MIPVAIPISMDTFYDRKYKSGLISFNWNINLFERNNEKNGS